MVYGAMHRPHEAKQALDRLLQMPRQDYLVAEVYAYARQTAPAFQYLERAYEGHSPDLLGLKADPLFAGLRGDPRYAALLHKLNLPE